MNMQTFFKILFLPLSLSMSFLSCGDGKKPTAVNDSSYQIQIPEETGDGWETASLSDVGVNENLIVDMVERVRINLYQNVHSIVIVKDEKLVFEEYFPGHDFGYYGENYHGSPINFNRDTWQNTHSATKSITSSLIGIAIDKGFIDSVETKIFTYFEAYSYLFNEEKDKITIEHLLTMTSGLQWNEWDVSVSESNHDIVRFNNSLDPVQFILSKPVVSEPGLSFYYNGGGVDLLGDIIRIATDMNVDDFSDQYLFSPLGIDKYEWQRLRSGMIACHGDVYIRPRDLAKFGYLFLNKGVWQGNRIISEEWVMKSLEKYISLNLSWADSYGYLWWQKTYSYNNQTFDSFKAMGWGGQEIIIFPSLNMVVVFTGSNYVVNPPCDEIIVRYILPAVS
jgi:CubicO group peptidase (beta-lactamase class C family)